MKRLYLAGPMRGYEAFNYPAFDTAAEQLRAVGYEVFSPAEHDRTIYGDLTPDNAHARGFSLRKALAADTAWICEQADGVALLPSWAASAGAVAERALALALDLPAVAVVTWIEWATRWSQP